MLDLTWHWLLLIGFIGTQIVNADVTLRLHREGAHRSLELGTYFRNFLRVYGWMHHGMVLREWVAIHRKHHVKCETEEDPHSPQIYGIWHILLLGVGYYRRESKNLETLETYGKGLPYDNFEELVSNTYGRFLGILISGLLYLLLLGPEGLLVWGIQIVWIPVTGAGVINGVGHYWGYRNTNTPDKSRNILPIGIIIGGEELHNNHHADMNSAKLSRKWFEFDIGWMWICIARALGNTKVIKPTA